MHSENVDCSVSGVTDMDSKAKQGPPTSDANNPELGAEALTRLVREALVEVFEARVKKMSETLQSGCLDWILVASLCLSSSFLSATTEGFVPLL
ncbi:hypothetical protein J1N35_034527 [Gossypium stocksii]|uniref:Uncharacterized protein n=1 Tax=Gossypium stocksii TaxID=47602 RepID=A0A9D3US85_9ROSI|nr:hypothetical protein J1N35_034527 [Gossypium stocksii]